MKYLGPTFLIIAAAGGAWLFFKSEPIKAKPAPRAPTQSELRAKEGPFILSTKKLSETEEISIVIMPSPYGDIFDTRCVIYRNREFKQATFNCPDAMARDLSGSD